MSEQIALFPLNTLLLPGGKTKLRVFEPRYIRLVKEASSGKRAFAMALLNPLVSQQHHDRIFTTATKVQVEDFDVLSDGLLGIEISGQQRVRILERWQENDGLHVASIEEEPFWSSTPMPDEKSPLLNRFRQLLDSEPMLAELYPNPRLDDSTWLAARWLELLPLPAQLKQQLCCSDGPEACLDYLSSCLRSEHSAH
ncbi:MAG: LON peptidase substrate-binding domain-containing protein [Alkalimonas sp.]|nr:LON peptidase substrate-binding domain-containing protein [Alkalimonas sp.]